MQKIHNTRQDRQRIYWPKVILEEGAKHLRWHKKHKAHKRRAQNSAKDEETEKVQKQEGQLN